MTGVPLQDGSIDGEFKMLSPEDLLSNDVDQLRLLLAERRDEERNQERASKPEGNKGEGKSEKGGRKSGGTAAADRSGPTPMEHDGIDVSQSCVSTLTGHESEVYICAWSPSEPLLASG